MQTFSDVIDAFGGPVPFGKAIGIPDTHARTMKARNSIPPDHWARTVSAAQSHQVSGVTFEKLAALRERWVKPAPEAADAA